MSSTMAARKLQTEIEKTLKKVAEGVEIFEGIFEKINSSTNQTQKEKLEVDLKSQIKKLQRLRDQIKTWMQSNDIKDKQPLQENRKLIETQMERFKACEKEMKTKAFSKEGLSATAKLDPKEQLKVELCSWLGTMVDELSRQVEQTEAEIETLQVLKKKKDTERGARLDELESMNERRLWHVAKLELILRLLENGNLLAEDVGNVKDDIAYFVESNTEEDFEEDEGIYDDLNLQEEEELYGQNNDDVLSSHDSASVAEDFPSVASTGVPPRTPARESARTLESTTSPTSTLPSKPLPAKAAATPAPTPVAARKMTIDSNRPNTTVPTPVRSTSGSASVPAPTPTRPVQATLPPIRYAAAAAAANVLPPSMVATPVITTTIASSTISAPPGFGVMAASVVTDSRHAASPEMMKASLPSSAPTTTVESSSHSSNLVVSPRLTSATSASNAMASLASPALSAASLNGNYTLSSNGTSSHLPVSPAVSATSLPTAAAAAAAGSDSTIVGRVPTVGSEQRLPSSLADLVTSFESAKQKSMKRDSDLSGIHKILESGYSNVPQPSDAEKPKYYVPRNPFQTPAYYPQEPSSHFSSTQVFAKFDIDTLFYIFYYCQGTYLQVLAASELKKQSWRFHKQYLTWFQRANEPQQITEDYERGAYNYFDWEGSWCQRRKSEFKFEYRYLEADS